VTAINVIRFRDAVHVGTDGLAYTGGGSTALAPKIYFAPHQPLVLATRGTLGAAQTFGMLVALYWDRFDAVVAGIEAAFPGLHENYRRSTGLPEDLPEVCNTEVIFAGWSAARGQAEAYYIRAGDAESSFESMKLIEVGYVFAAPWPSSLTPAANLTEDEDSVRANMLAIAEAQRREFPQQVGGFLQLTTLTKETITSRILRRWDLPDRTELQLATKAAA
jgi:hypothetical protein